MSGEGLMCTHLIYHPVDVLKLAKWAWRGHTQSCSILPITHHITYWELRLLSREINVQNSNNSCKVKLIFAATSESDCPFAIAAGTTLENLQSHASSGSPETLYLNWITDMPHYITAWKQYGSVTACFVLLHNFFSSWVQLNRSTSILVSIKISAPWVCSLFDAECVSSKVKHKRLPFM